MKSFTTTILSLLAISSSELTLAMPYPNGSFDAILALLHPNTSAKTVQPRFSNSSIKAVQPPFLNRTDAVAPCVPFEDPHCCVDGVVCMCNNGVYSPYQVYITVHADDL
ncbi:hypothetical protein F4779DRAFT_618973 [Xylariaceae sp. FL0662B]|nr:hypothetical protein F4779DRAFT_618973 [Xylariaceae sp. FL0662B]